MGKTIKPGANVKNLHPLLAKFLKKIDERLGSDSYVVTSGYRKGSKHRHGKEDGAEALDFRPSEKLYDFLQNTKEGLQLLINHKLGFLDETSAEAQKKYKATGANYHIGMDKDKEGNLYGNPSARLASMNKGEIMALDPDFIVSQKTSDYKKEVGDEYDNAYDEIKNDESLTILERKQKLQDLDKRMFDEGKIKALNLKKYNQGKEALKEIKSFEKGENLAGLIYNISQKEDTTYEGENVKSTLTEKEYNQLKEQLPEKDFKSLKFTKRTTSPGGEGGKSIGKRLNNGYNLKAQTDQFYLNADKWYLEKTGKNLLLESSSVNNMFVFNKKDKIDTTDLKKTKNFIETGNNLIKVKPEWKKEKEETVINEDESETVINEDGSETVVDEPKPKTDFDKKAEEVFSSFLDKEELISPDTFQYDTNDFDKQLPIGALAQGALGLIGLGDADTELPLRDEQVSQAILNFAKTNKKLSEMGLRPEEEAAMKSDVAEAYQQGMSELVRASGGNRNLVTGNASSLNLNRLKGITNISLADIERKDSAYDKYGKTLEYIENFNTNRDVANHGIKLGEAQQKQQAGAALAASGFAGMIEELQYQKENGPGSANHMLRQQLEYSTFGVVSGLKNQDDPNKVGTYAYKKAQDEGIAAKKSEDEAFNNMNAAFKRKYYSLPENERKALGNDFLNQIQDDGVRKNWTENGILALPQEKQLAEPSPNSEVGTMNMLPNSNLKEEINNAPRATGMSGFLV
jgi:hypothetical protein